MKTVNLIVLRCRDIEKSRAFYECQGMTFLKHRHGNGPEHYSHEDEAGVFELYPARRDNETDQTGLGFAARDLDAMFYKLVTSGFAPEVIKQNEWGRTFVVKDPDGRRIEIKEVK